MLSSLILNELKFSIRIPSNPIHEIHGVERGLGVFLGSKCIVGEGAGIGMPVALDFRKTVFPGEAEITEGELAKRFKLNKVSIKYLGGLRVEQPYRKVRSFLAPLYIKNRVFRPLYFFLMALRTVLGVKSRYESVEEKGYVDVKYGVEGNAVEVRVDASNLRCNKFLIANELSGRLFTKLTIDDLDIERIPPWMEVRGKELSLISPQLGLSMTIKKPPQCRLFAGREVLGRRLDWAGFSCMPDTRRFRYRVEFERID